MKKAILLSICLLFAGYLLAEDTFKDGKFTYKVLTDNTVAVHSYEYADIKDITVPSSVTYNSTKYRVIAIGSYGFSGVGRLTSVTLPTSIITIEVGAFNSCIGLISFDIPESVESIAGDAFLGCTSLTKFTVNADNVNYKSVDGVILTKDGKKLVAFPGGKSGSYTVPDGVTEIGDNACAKNKLLTQIAFPSSLSTIGGSAFSGCEGLTSIVLSEGVSTLGDAAFKACKGLLSFSISKSVKTIGEGVWTNCSKLQTINVDTENENYASIDGVLFDKQQTTLLMYPLAKGDVYETPASTTVIANKAFQYSNISTITFSDGITEIGEYAFGDCGNLTELTLPAHLETIGNDAFETCLSLKTVIISSAKTIGRYAFLNCGALKTISLPESLEEIKDFAFWGCKKLDDFVIPNKVKSIGEAAFYKCRAATEITLGTSIETIGALAFASCDDLMIVNSLNPIPPVVTADTFGNGETYLTLHVPEGKQDDYKAANVWENFKEIIADLRMPTNIMNQETNIFMLDNSLKGYIGITSDRAQMVFIYNMEGKLITKAVLQEGTIHLPLSAGAYIVRGDSQSQKVVVK